MLEETDVQIEIKDLFLQRDIEMSDGIGIQHEEYYTCDYVSGKPYLKESSEEYKEM